MQMYEVNVGRGGPAFWTTCVVVWHDSTNENVLRSPNTAASKRSTHGEDPRCIKPGVSKNDPAKSTLESGWCMGVKGMCCRSSALAALR